MSPSCPVCKLANTRPTMDYFDWKVIHCRNSEFRFAAGGLPIEMQAHYDEDYFLPMIERDNSAKWQTIYQQKLELARDLGPGRKLLEVGPGAGGFAIAAVTAGYSVFAVDGSQAAIDRLGKFGIAGVVADLNSISLPANCYDVVNSSHVVEHLSLPADLLEAVFETLKPGGVLLLSFPAYEAWLLNIRDSIYRIGLANHPYNYQAPDHVSYFSKRCIEKVLRSRGYTIHEVSRTKFISLRDVIERLDASSPFRQFACWISGYLGFLFSRIGFHRDLDIVAVKPVSDV